MSKLLELTQGRVALISSSDYPRASRHKWRYRNGHPVTTLDEKEVSLGRFILGVVESAKVYYKDGDACNCLRSNLTQIWKEQNKYKNRKDE